ncbi:antibiotic biosynthesis monooxygenase family protein [Streptomonospora algeriensis]|uniref:Antibiotic biosynthesis monooxygenase family protein n=1 Tax=Streptomonospora algeriensis TaxID=995084 RepID=A0ABW3BD65_9ACTN
MDSRARVLVWHRGDDPEALVRAYTEAAPDLAEVEGLERTELLFGVAGAGFGTGPVVLEMHFTDIEAFRRWERSPQHRQKTSPMRRFQDRSRPGGHYEIYEVPALDAGVSEGRDPR